MTTPKLGEGTCQCASCGEFFTTTGNFDKHRIWGIDGQARACVAPESVGLALRSNGAYGGPPMTDEQKAARGWAS